VPGEHMMKSKRLVAYRIPYVVLVSKFIEYFCVPLDGELSEPFKQHHEVTTATLHKIGLKKVNNAHWVCQADAESAGAETEEEKVRNVVDMNMGDVVGPSD